MEEIITIETVLLKLAELISAVCIVFGAVFAGYRWYLKQNNVNTRQSEEIKLLKEEQTIICYGVLAALKGLKEQGCNGPVTEAINKIEKHLNVQAHK